MNNDLTTLTETLEVLIDGLDGYQMEIDVYFNIIYNKYHSMIENIPDYQVIHQSRENGFEVFFYDKDYKTNIDDNMIQQYENHISSAKLRIQNMKQRIASVEMRIAQLKKSN